MDPVHDLVFQTENKVLESGSVSVLSWKVGDASRVSGPVSITGEPKSVRSMYVCTWDPVLSAGGGDRKICSKNYGDTHENLNLDGEINQNLTERGTFFGTLFYVWNYR